MAIGNYLGATVGQKMGGQKGRVAGNFIGGSLVATALYRMNVRPTMDYLNYAFIAGFSAIAVAGECVIWKTKQNEQEKASIKVANGGIEFNYESK